MADIINPPPILPWHGPSIQWLKSNNAAPPNGEEGFRWRYILATATQRRATRPANGMDPINEQHVWNEWKRPDPAKAHVRQIDNMVVKHRATTQKQEYKDMKRKYQGSLNLVIFLFGGFMFYMLFA